MCREPLTPQPHGGKQECYTGGREEPPPQAVPPSLLCVFTIQMDLHHTGLACEEAAEEPARVTGLRFELWTNHSLTGR